MLQESPTKCCICQAQNFGTPLTQYNAKKRVLFLVPNITLAKGNFLCGILNFNDIKVMLTIDVDATPMWPN